MVSGNVPVVGPFGWILVYLALVLLGGGLVAPLLHELAQAAAVRFPALEALAGQPFHRYVNRSMLFIAVAGLWPFLRGIGIRSWRDAGLRPFRGEGQRLLAGMAVGFSSLALAVLLIVAGGGGHWDWDHSPARWFRHLRNAVLAAVIVSVLEEVLFRGALFGALRRAWDWRAALAASSLLFALVHFFQKPPPPPAIHWWTGLAVLGQMFGGWTELRSLVPGLINLGLAGLILGWAYQRTGTLYFSIGLHAGWIFWLKTYGLLTDPVAGRNDWIWGTGKLIDGWLASGILLGTLAVCRRFWERPWRSGNSGG